MVHFASKFFNHGEYVDLEVEHVEEKSLRAVILTKLPEKFALGTGDSIDLYEDEICYKTDEQEHKAWN